MRRALYEPVCTIRPENSEVRFAVTVVAFDADPNFSPDGQQIAFASLRDGKAEIYLMNVDGSDVRRLTNHPSWDSHPVFSPDGTVIAFPSDCESEDSDVYLMRSDGTGLVRRPTFWSSNESVGRFLPPDGTKIAVVSDRSGNDDVFVLTAELSHLINHETPETR